MPQKPLKPCWVIGCPNTIREGKYCKLHVHTEKKIRKPDTRKSAYKRGYNAEFLLIRARVLRENPICDICGINKSTTAHHIPDYVQGTSHKDYEYQAVCAGCHNKLRRKR